MVRTVAVYICQGQKSDHITHKLGSSASITRAKGWLIWPFTRHTTSSEDRAGIVREKSDGATMSSLRANGSSETYKGVQTVEGGGKGDDVMLLRAMPSALRDISGGDDSRPRTFAIVVRYDGVVSSRAGKRRRWLLEPRGEGCRGISVLT
ncbi:hypothetical protein EJ04DRAFT_41799 [Polyplosphaeria fusca]|uniref:Uncharacterized protein n=1 Tax=Polyplosphaeria fusca TaxID=682080 RepID=A0A9P4R7S3_9PLEO|nr:hypothetical protein EJ04DRAFT_41799 [Polyplosphaeria fusca]